MFMFGDKSIINLSVTVLTVKNIFRSVAASGLDCKHIQKPSHWIPHNGKCPELVMTTDNFEVGMQSQVKCFIANKHI